MRPVAGTTVAAAMPMSKPTCNMIWQSKRRHAFIQPVMTTRTLLRKDGRCEFDSCRMSHQHPYMVVQVMPFSAILDCVGGASSNMCAPLASEAHSKLHQINPSMRAVLLQNHLDPKTLRNQLVGRPCSAVDTAHALYSCQARAVGLHESRQTSCRRLQS